MKAHLLELLKSGTPANIELALTLEISQGIDLHDFWAPLQKLYRLIHGQEGDKRAYMSLRFQEYLSLGSKSLTAIPEEICLLDAQLSYLGLAENNLDSLPHWFDQLSSLTELDLSQNRFSGIMPEAICRLPQLSILDIYQNELTALPESVSQLSQLFELNIKNNYLQTLPEGISAWKNLIWIDAGHNRLETLPEGIGALASIIWLDFNSNRLRMIPESIGQLHSLEVLDLSNNQLKTLPESIFKLPFLYNIKLGNNPALEAQKSMIMEKFEGRVAVDW